MTRALPALLAATAALALAPAARADEETKPLDGDLQNGGRLYRTQCAACHGLGAEGDGPLAPSLTPRPTALRLGGWLLARPEAGLVTALSGGIPAAKSGGLAHHSRPFTALEARDLLAWLRAPVPDVRDFFPDTVDYIAHEQVIDEFGVDRASKALGRDLTDEERRLLVVTAFKPLEPGEALPKRPRKIAEEPAALYAALPKRKLGFVTHVPLALDGGVVQAVLALDRRMLLVGVRTVPSADPKVEKLRKKHAGLLEAFVGSGGREEKHPIAPQKRGLRAPKDVQREMLKAYTLALEGAAMYEKEERERFWADPEAFKFEIADMPDEVKFDFKEKKSK